MTTNVIQYGVIDLNDFWRWKNWEQCIHFVILYRLGYGLFFNYRENSNQMQQFPLLFILLPFLHFCPTIHTKIRITLALIESVLSILLCPFSTWRNRCCCFYLQPLLHHIDNHKNIFASLVPTTTVLSREHTLLHAEETTWKSLLGNPNRNRYRYQDHYRGPRFKPSSCNINTLKALYDRLVANVSPRSLLHPGTMLTTSFAPSVGK